MLSAFYTLQQTEADGVFFFLLPSLSREELRRALASLSSMSGVGGDPARGSNPRRLDERRLRGFPPQEEPDVAEM